MSTADWFAEWTTTDNNDDDDDKLYLSTVVIKAVSLRGHALT